MSFSQPVRRAFYWKNSLLSTCCLVDAMSQFIFKKWVIKLVSFMVCFASHLNAQASETGPTLRFSIHEHHKPYLQVAPFEGIFKRLLNQLRRDTGYEFIPVWRSGDANGTEALLEGQVDFIIDPPNKIIHETNPAWLTLPMVHGHAAIVKKVQASRNVSSSNQDPKIGYLSGIIDLRENDSSSKWISSKSTTELVNHLINETIESAVIPVRLAHHLLTEGLAASISIDGLYPDKGFSYPWIFHPDKLLEKQRIETAIAQWPDDLKNKLFTNSTNLLTSARPLASPKWLLPTGTLGICVFIAMISWVWQLRRDRLRILQRETKLVASKSKAIAASTAKSNFLATISHEIRTPMHAVLGVHELLLQKNSLNADDHRLLQSAQTSAKSLLEILNQVLDVSKIEAGKFKLKLHAVSVRSTLQSIITPFEALAHAKKISCESTVDPNVSSSLLIDELRFRQVLQNLLSNAIKFTNEGSIRLSCRVLSDTHASQLLEFCVADTGIGIHSNDIKRLLEPYEQVTNNQLHHGTGLGLSIAHGIVNSMGGQLIIESDLGYGTSVSFSICLNRSSAQPKLCAPSSKGTNLQSPLPTFSSRTCLIVDDHAANLAIMEIQLQRLGFTTLTASNGLDALSILASSNVDLVITDESMPRMSGRELSSRIRQAHPNIFIIGLTADIFAIQAKESYLISGMNDLLIKPIDLTQLHQCLGSFFNTKQTWDIKALNAYTHDCHQSSRKIIQTILETQETALAILSNRSTNLNQMKPIAHQLRGGAHLINAWDIVSACIEIESLEDSNDRSMVLDALIQAIRQNNHELRQFLMT